MSEPSLIDIASRLAIFAANEADEEGDLNHVPKSIIVDSKAELDRLRAQLKDRAVLLQDAYAQLNRLRAEVKRLEAVQSSCYYDIIRLSDELDRPRAENVELLKRLKNRLDLRLNNYLGEMKEGYDDSIVGFNEAVDVMRKVFDEESVRTILTPTHWMPLPDPPKETEG